LKIEIEQGHALMQGAQREARLAASEVSRRRRPMLIMEPIIAALGGVRCAIGPRSV